LFSFVSLGYRRLFLNGRPFREYQFGYIFWQFIRIQSIF
jgi:hypothetical protein